jgi:hypothetical protein
MNIDLTIDWIFWVLLFIFSCFVSVHSMITPTPAEEEEHLRSHPDVRGVYPWSDQNITQREIYELGAKYAKRLRFAGLIGLILTLVVTICTFLPFQSLPVFDKSSKVTVSCFAFIIILLMLRFVEKGTWPFKAMKDKG